MGPFDRKCWEAFIDNHPNFFDQVCYDVPVGQGLTVTDDPEINFQKMATALTQHRIDVLATIAARVFICEIKPALTPPAIGQLLMYKTLFTQTFPNVHDVGLMAIHFTATEDAYLCAREHRVHTLLAASEIPA